MRDFRLSLIRICLFVLLVLPLADPMVGFAAQENIPAEQIKIAAASEDEGRGEGFRPERKEEAKEGEKKEERKEDECPATFGPIITDTAIPIEKGKFAIQPTFGLSFVTNSLTHERYQPSIADASVHIFPRPGPSR